MIETLFFCNLCFSKTNVTVCALVDVDAFIPAATLSFTFFPRSINGRIACVHLSRVYLGVRLTDCFYILLNASVSHACYIAVKGR